MKLQDFPSLGVDYYGMRIVWRQGYHRQISGQSVHIADRERKWDANHLFEDRWGAYDDDTGYMIVTASTMRECIVRCEDYIARHSAFFASDEYVELCKQFLALRKADNNDDRS